MARAFDITGRDARRGPSGPLPWVGVLVAGALAAGLFSWDLALSPPLPAPIPQPEGTTLTGTDATGNQGRTDHLRTGFFNGIAQHAPR